MKSKKLSEKKEKEIEEVIRKSVELADREIRTWKKFKKLALKQIKQ